MAVCMRATLECSVFASDLHFCCSALVAPANTTNDTAKKIHHPPIVLICPQIDSPHID